MLGVTTDDGDFTWPTSGGFPAATGSYWAFMPQWDFLDFAASARRLEGFELRMRAEAVEVLERPAAWSASPTGTRTGRRTRSGPG